MGLWSFLTGAPAPLLAPVTPFAPQDSLQQLVVGELWPEAAGVAAPLTRESALRIPAVKRAHDITCGVLARMPWALYNGRERVTPQPRWLVTSDTGIAPRGLRWGVVSDLFMSGWALLGFHIEDDEPFDALHIPYGMWNVDQQSREIVVDASIDAKYKRRLVLINLGYGSSGMLVDGRGTLTDARIIEAAYRDRIENPIAQTVLTLAGDRWDYWTKEEREDFRKQWIKGRQASNGATALKPDWVTVDYTGQLATDLFESARNANRLDVANHAGIPAALLEGSKHGGSDGQMSYSNETDRRNELWDYGLAKYADAIESRLSLDDVCAHGLSIRVEPGHYLTAPTPTTPIPSED